MSFKLLNSLDGVLAAVRPFSADDVLSSADFMSLNDRGGTTEYVYRPDRPAILVSSTSWTADEDFNILLESLQLYEQRARLRKPAAGSDLPRVLVVVTGKGPLKDHYLDQVRKLEDLEQWQYVRCISMWLSAENYPRLLGTIFQETNEKSA